MTTMLDATTADVATVEEIRSHFPALHRMHNGNPVAYFDGPGGTQVPRGVVRRIVEPVRGGEGQASGDDHAAAYIAIWSRRGRPWIAEGCCGLRHGSALR